MTYKINLKYTAGSIQVKGLVYWFKIVLIAIILRLLVQYQFPVIHYTLKYYPKRDRLIMQTSAIITLLALSFTQALSIAGDVSRDTASPDTRINLGQMQKADINIVGGRHRFHSSKMMMEEMPHESFNEVEVAPHTEQAGPAVIKGCYKLTPVYKTHYKTVPSFKTVETQVKVMVPDTKTIKTFRTVERVVKHMVPEFKEVQILRPEYKTVTTRVPTTKTVTYKTKSFIKKYLPPTYIPETITPMEHIAFSEPHTMVEGTHAGSPKIDVKVGSLANYDQDISKH